MAKERKGSCQAIRELRERSGMTITELARRMGVSHPTVIQWEQGLNNPSVENLIRVATIFGCTTDEIVGKTTLHQAAG